MVRGKNGKWLGLSCTVPAQSTTVSPYWTRQDPWASLAMRPNSRLNVRPANWRSILLIMFSFLCCQADGNTPSRTNDPVGNSPIGYFRREIDSRNAGNKSAPTRARGARPDAAVWLGRFSWLLLSKFRRGRPSAAATPCPTPTRRLLKKYRLLMTESQIRDDLTVSLEVRALQVFQKASTAAHHLEKATAAVVILLVRVEV